jgi:hypothetical protein
MLFLIANKKHEQKDDALNFITSKDYLILLPELQINLQNNLCLLVLMPSLN